MQHEKQALAFLLFARIKCLALECVRRHGCAHRRVGAFVNDCNYSPVCEKVEFLITRVVLLHIAELSRHMLHGEATPLVRAKGV